MSGKYGDIAEYVAPVVISYSDGDKTRKPASQPQPTSWNLEEV
jgi:hypothetical protein